MVTFRSLWAMFIEWRDFKALAIWIKADQIYFSSIGELFDFAFDIFLYKSPSSANSVIKLYQLILYQRVAVSRSRNDSL